MDRSNSEELPHDPGEARSPADCCDHRHVFERLNATIEDLRLRTGIDELTGAATRAVVEDAGCRELSRQTRYGHPVSLVFCDIDGFKRVNDCFGHSVGDDVLRTFARLLSAESRLSDIVARWGGEEFVVLLPNTGIAGARALAEKQRRAVAGATFPVVGHVTASFGVAQAGIDETWRGWTHRADMAMYQAKREGRNRVVAAPAVARHVESTAAGFLHLVWRDAYCCGHPVIDAQHAALFAIANDLLHAAATDSATGDIAPLMRVLIDECRRHFVDEERILAANGYMDLPAHARVHAELLERAEQLYVGVIDGTGHLGLVLGFIVRDLVAGHMLKEDRTHFPMFAAAA